VAQGVAAAGEAGRRRPGVRQHRDIAFRHCEFESGWTTGMGGYTVRRRRTVKLPILVGLLGSTVKLTVPE
jgi:hypothetical protein